MAIHIRWRDLIAALGVAWPLVALISGTLASVALATGAVAQKSKVPLNTLKAMGVALQACWIPPPINQARPGMQITVMMSFNRNGELFGQPKITFESIGASNDERLAYRIAVAEMLERCTPLQFTDTLGNAVAGRPFTMRLIDARKLKQAYRNKALSPVVSRLCRHRSVGCDAQGQPGADEVSEERLSCCDCSQPPYGTERHFAAAK